MMVRTVRRTFLSTGVLLLLLFLVMLLVDIYSIKKASLDLVRNSRLLMKTSIQLFTQETFKERSGGTAGISDLPDITDAVGNPVVGGSFYRPFSNKYDVYAALYLHSAEFHSWLVDHSSHFDSVRLLRKGIEGDYSGADGVTARGYIEDLVTPVNLGIPYVDRRVLENIFQWELGMYYSGGDFSAVGTDINGSYVNADGLKIYFNRSRVKKMSYEIYDLNTDEGVSSFQRISNIDPQHIKQKHEKMCVLTVTYSVVAQPVGVTGLLDVVGNFTGGGSISRDALEGDDDGSSGLFIVYRYFIYN